MDCVCQNKQTHRRVARGSMIRNSANSTHVFQFIMYSVEWSCRLNVRFDHRTTNTHITFAGFKLTWLVQVDYYASSLYTLDYDIYDSSLLILRSQTMINAE